MLQEKSSNVTDKKTDTKNTMVLIEIEKPKRGRPPKVKPVKPVELESEESEESEDSD